MRKADLAKNQNGFKITCICPWMEEDIGLIREKTREREVMWRVSNARC